MVENANCLLHYVISDHPGHFYTLSLKRNTLWNHRLALWPRVKVMWPRPGHIMSQEFVTGRKRPRSKISEFVKQANLHWLPCIFGSQWRFACFTNSKNWRALRLYKILDRVFCDLLQIPVTWYDPAGVTWPWPWVTGQADESTVCFFWDWVYVLCLV